MAEILSLISTSSQNNEERYKFILDLLVSKSDVPFDKEEINAIQDTLLSLINNQLNHAATRHDGLKLLLKTLPRCPKESLIKYATLWMKKAMQTLDSAQNDTVQVTSACELVARLAILFKDIPELQKQLSMQYVKQIIAHVNGLTEEKRYGAVFYLIAVLLYHYPEPCEKLQVTIRKLILPLIDSPLNNLVSIGAKCFALLTFATERSFQAQANKVHLTAWTHSQILICNSLHETMDALFSGITEIEYADTSDKLILPAISQSDIMVHHLGLERRFNNLCIFLSTTLRGCGHKNSVSPDNILKILSRGLFVTPAGLGNENAFKKQILHLILPNLHTSLLNVLDALVSGFGKELVPYAQTILQLLQQILTWTERATENSTTLDGCRPYKHVRVQAYTSLSTWLTHVGALSGFDSLCEEFLAHIVRDIVPEKDRVVLSVQKTHNMSKRALKRHRENQYDNNLTQSNSVTVPNPLLNAESAQEALIALQNIILHTGCRLKLSFYETLQSVVVTLLYDCYLETSEQTFYRLNSSCRLHLLKALKMLQLNPHPSIPPLTQHCLEIFQIAQNDDDLSIIEEVKVCLTEVEKIVHPGAPTLRLPIAVDESSPEDEETNDNIVVPPNISSDKILNNSMDNIENTTEESLAVTTVIILGDKPVEDITDMISQEKSDSVANSDAEKITFELDDSNDSKICTLSTSQIVIDGGPSQLEILSNTDEGDSGTLNASQRDQGDFSVVTTDKVSDTETGEPSIKKQGIEVITSSATDNKDNEKPEGEKDSDDDITMLELFCDTVQDDK